MAYTGKKPVDHTDVTQSQSMTVTDDLTVDTNTLHVDSTNNRVGIGTSSPSQVLEITNGTSPAYVVQTRGDLQTILGPTGSLVTSAGQVGTITNSPFRFTTNNTERMRIDSSGNVGIGTSSTASSSAVKTVFSNATGGTYIQANSGSNGGAVFGTDGGGASLFFTYTGAVGSESYSERMRIDNSGNVLFGGATSTFISGAQDGGILTNDGAGTFSTSDDAALYLSRRGTTGDIVVFKNDTSIVGEIVVNSASVSYNTTSDYRLKENVTGITDGIERVKQLNPSRFNFIADADTTVDGFLAHEVSDIVPEAITGEKDAVDEDGNPEYQGIDQAKLVPLLTAALKEAITKIEDLEARVATLEGN